MTGDDFPRNYQATLAAFLDEPGADVLEEAHRLGQRALGRALSLGFIGELHHDTAHRLVAGRQDALDALRRAEAFFLEVVSVYDTALADYRSSRACAQLPGKGRPEEDETVPPGAERQGGGREDRRQAADDFAYAASHDLKEPLRAIHNHARFLMEDYQDDLDKDGVRRLERISALCAKVEKLITDLFDYSRLGQEQGHAETIDLEKIIDQTSLYLDGMLKQRHARLLVKKPLPKVLGKRAAIGRLFRELIENAVMYNDAEEKVVEIGAQAASPHDEPGSIVLSIRDNGIGIEARFHDKVFGMFKRLNADNAYGEGTGAGLAFAQRIAENHGGRISLTSEEGQGSTFFITLPKPT